MLQRSTILDFIGIKSSFFLSFSFWWCKLIIWRIIISLRLSASNPNKCVRFIISSAYSSCLNIVDTVSWFSSYPLNISFVSTSRPWKTGCALPISCIAQIKMICCFKTDSLIPANSTSLLTSGLKIPFIRHPATIPVSNIWSINDFFGFSFAHNFSAINFVNAFSGFTISCRPSKFSNSYDG